MVLSCGFLLLKGSLSSSCITQCATFPRTRCARVSVVTNMIVVLRGLSRAFTGRVGRQEGTSE